jgi:hypothetical protein
MLVLPLSFMIAQALGLDRTMGVTFIGLSVWSRVVCPFCFLESPMVSESTALVMSAAQWLAAASAIAVTTRSLRLGVAVIVALVTILGIGLSILGLLRVVGHPTYFEVP